MNLAGEESKPDRVAAAVAALVAIGFVIAALLELRSEIAVQQVEAALARQQLAIGQKAVPPPPPQVTSAAPRARLGVALYLARQAPWTPDPAAALQRSRLVAEEAAAARPYWGEAWMVVAYARALQKGNDAAGIAEALRRSYDGSPFLRDAAGWRVRTGLEVWPLLDRQTRERMVEEAVWLARLERASRRAIFAAARSSDAYWPLLLRWHAVRGLDADRQRPQ